MKINTINPAELKLLFDSNASVQLIDIREKYEIEIDGTLYYTDDIDIYSILENDDIGDIVGKFTNGEAIIF